MKRMNKWLLRLNSLRNRSLQGVRQRTGWDPVTRLRIKSVALVNLGSADCSWPVPEEWNVQRPVCLCVGAGEDISFDLQLARLHSARVFIFDPTPRAIEHVEPQIRSEDSIVFRPWAIWREDGTVEMYEPADSSHVSHSIVNLQSTSKALSVPARSIPSVLREFGLDRVDLLKLDIEGAEYEVLLDCVVQDLDIGIINVEFDELSIPHRGGWRRIRMSARGLANRGYTLCSVDKGTNYCFLGNRHLANFSK